MKVLEAASDLDRDAWLEHWNACGREPHAHPGYCSTFLGPGERAIALALTGRGGRALLPLILRPLPYGVAGFDAVSPYGYGGPYTSGSLGPNDMIEALEGWASGADICSVFVRLSLGIPIDSTFSATRDVVHVADNVIVSVNRDTDEIWRRYDHKVRKNVKKAQRAGCTVRRDEKFAALDAFMFVYTDTLRRRAAAEWFHFDGALFDRLERELQGSLSVFSVFDAGGDTVSVELVLESDDYVYSFLGGTLEAAFPMAPNDLLKHEVAIHAQGAGRKGYVLGGGFTPGDGIFRYKRSFDPGGVVPFHGLRLISDRRRYNDLLDARKQIQVGPFPSKYFPAYRTPLAVAPR